MVHQLVPNPAWVTRTIAKTYETLQDTIPQAWMPKLGDVASLPWGQGLVAKPREYGHGVYGAVLPTLDPDVVLKVTSDETEAEFASTLASTLVSPICVRYYKVLETPDYYKGNRVFLLWRDSANHVGQIGDVDGVDAHNLINEQHAIAQEAYDAVHKRPQSPSQRALKLLEQWAESLRLVARETTSVKLADLMNGMRTVWDAQHIFFGDIHAGNIGMVDDKWVITDPGHVAVVAT